MLNIIKEAGRRILQQWFNIHNEINSHIPKNIYRTPRPTCKDLKVKKYSRFSKENGNYQLYIYVHYANIFVNYYII